MVASKPDGFSCGCSGWRGGFVPLALGSHIFLDQLRALPATCPASMYRPSLMRKMRSDTLTREALG
jgi:hypothetical protein